MSESLRISKKKKFINDGVLFAEIHEFLSKSLAEAGYSGLEVRNSVKNLVLRVKVINKAEAVGPQGFKLNELELLIQKRFGFQEGFVKIIFEPLKNKTLSAEGLVEVLKDKMVQGTPVRSAAMFIINRYMKNKVNTSQLYGIEVVVSGKLRQQRAKTIKYKGGYLISTGQPKLEFIQVAIRHVFFKLGIVGIKVKIMLPYDNKGLNGINKLLPDKVEFKPVKEEVNDDLLPNTNANN